MAGDVKEPLAIVGGMVVGKLAGDLLTKATASAAGIKGLKGLKGLPAGLLTSVLLVGGGLAAKQLLKNPTLKSVGVGMATYGGIIIIQDTINLPVSVTPNPALPPPAGMGRLGTPAKRMVTPSNSGQAPGNPVVL